MQKRLEVEHYLVKADAYSHSESSSSPVSPSSSCSRNYRTFPVVFRVSVHDAVAGGGWCVYVVFYV